MIPALLRQSRPKQWVKNVLVFAAPAAAGVLDDPRPLVRAIVMFVAMCLAASGTYYWNDLLDIEADRVHPTKRDRPVASGAVPVMLAGGVGALLLASGIALSFALRWQAGLVVVFYVVLTISYSVVWKHIAVLDLLVVAMGFLLRAIAGGQAVDVPLSSWFLLCTGFASLFIVTGKRYAELREFGDGAAEHRATLDEYSLGFLRIVLSVACSASIVTYCIWAFDTQEGSGSDWPFYELSIIPVLAALLRYTLILEQGHGAAPEEIFAADRTLQVLGVVWVAVFAAGIYAT